MMGWESVTPLLLVYTAGLNAAIDTGLYAGPQWQNISPLDCLYTTVQRTTLQAFEIHSWLRDRWTIASVEDGQDQSATFLSWHFSGCPEPAYLLFSNFATTCGALVMFLASNSGVWIKVFIVNAMVYWLSGKIRVTRISTSADLSDTSPLVPTASSGSQPTDPLIAEEAIEMTAPSAKTSPVGDGRGTVHAELAISLAFVFIANTVLWCVAPNLKMDALCWLYFVISNIILGSCAVWFCRKTKTSLGIFHHLGIGVVDLQDMAAAWVLGYSDVQRWAAAKKGWYKAGMSDFHLLTISFLTLSILTCLWRKVNDKRHSWWSQLIPVTVFVLVTGIYHIVLYHDSWM